MKLKLKTSNVRNRSKNRAGKEQPGGVVYFHKSWIGLRVVIMPIGIYRDTINTVKRYEKCLNTIKQRSSGALC